MSLNQNSVETTIPNITGMKFQITFCHTTRFFHLKPDFRKEENKNSTDHVYIVCSSDIDKPPLSDEYDSEEFVGILGSFRQITSRLFWRWRIHRESSDPEQPIWKPQRDDQIFLCIFPLRGAWLRFEILVRQSLLPSIIVTVKKCQFLAEANSPSEALAKKSIEYEVASIGCKVNSVSESEVKLFLDSFNDTPTSLMVTETLIRPCMGGKFDQVFLNCDGDEFRFRFFPDSQDTDSLTTTTGKEDFQKVVLLSQDRMSKIWEFV